ncbi:hypothetical protein QEG73_00385 [Chitinophagaceae bacterium 26-R-25]|nr:hypothetical protein [Chitinophagaceae bacterium 26-R-25]
MKNLNLKILLFFVAVSCGQKKSSTKTLDATTNEQLVFDTNRITVIPVDTSDHWLFKDAKSFRLTTQDLKSVETIFNDCVRNHNIKQDTTKDINEFIDLKKYKVQYVPFIGSNGDKKVYVNCFCSFYWNYDSSGWKKYLIAVKDGGSCFFHVTINLTTNKYEEFYTNGYG